MHNYEHVQWWNPEKVARETGEPLDLVRQTMAEIAGNPSGHRGVQVTGPKNRHRNHRNCLVIQSANSVPLFVGIMRQRANHPCETIDVVDVRRFADACLDAIATARGVCNAGRNTAHYQRLMRYDIDVAVDGMEATMRLDIACALAKRARRLPTDAYGDEIKGAMLSADGKRWVVAYATDRRLEPHDRDAGNIDHVVPRSEGGKSYLCNLHVMRTANNSRKSSRVMPDVSGEPQESLRIIDLLIDGTRLATREGRMDAPVAERLLDVLAEETQACLEMLSAAELIRFAAGNSGSAVARLATKVAGGIRRAVGDARSATPRKALMGVASASFLGGR